MGARRANISALATSTSRVIQLIACFVVSAYSKDVKLKLSAMFEKSGLLMKDFIHLSLPALGSDVMWSTGVSAYAAIMGHISSDMVAANSLVMVVRNFGTVLCYGIANSCMIIVGKDLGASEFERAEEDTKRSMHLTIAAGIGGGLVVALIRPIVLHYASLSPTAMGYLSIMLLINTYYIMGTAINSSAIAGLFRAGGDSKFGFICDAVGMWAYAVPLGCIAAFVLKLPPMWVYFLVCTDEFFKWPWVIRHYRSRKWMKNITRETI
jgi:Na+-driven multidrug efflux pump